MCYGSDWNSFQVFPEILVHFLHLSVTTTKFVVMIISCFFKYWTWLHRISLHIFEFLATIRDLKFILIRVYNSRKCFLDKVERHSFFRVTWKHWVPKWDTQMGVLICVVIKIDYQTVFRSSLASDLSTRFTSLVFYIYEFI